MSPWRLIVIGSAAATLLAGPAGAQQARRPGGPATLIDEVREATDRFQDVAAAQVAGYEPVRGCVSGPTGGAMGLHYVNFSLVGDGGLDSRRPEALMYEARNGRLQLVGVEFIVPAALWDAARSEPPVLLGQLFHFTDSPNRYAIGAFYALHVWARRENPSGVFADWNPRVSCAEHTTEAAAAGPQAGH